MVFGLKHKLSFLNFHFYEIESFRFITMVVSRRLHAKMFRLILI